MYKLHFFVNTNKQIYWYIYVYIFISYIPKYTKMIILNSDIFVIKHE